MSTPTHKKIIAILINRLSLASRAPRTWAHIYSYPACTGHRAHNEIQPAEASNNSYTTKARYTSSIYCNRPDSVHDVQKHPQQAPAASRTWHKDPTGLAAHLDLQQLKAPRGVGLCAHAHPQQAHARAHDRPLHALGQAVCIQQPPAERVGTSGSGTVTCTCRSTVKRPSLTPSTSACSPDSCGR